MHFEAQIKLSRIAKTAFSTRVQTIMVFEMGNLDVPDNHAAFLFHKYLCTDASGANILNGRASLTQGQHFRVIGTSCGGGYWYAFNKSMKIMANFLYFEKKGQISVYYIPVCFWMLSQAAKKQKVSQYHCSRDHISETFVELQPDF